MIENAVQVDLDMVRCVMPARLACAAVVVSCVSEVDFIQSSASEWLETDSPL